MTTLCAHIQIVEGEGDERSYFKEGQTSRLKAGFLYYNLEAEFPPFQKTSVFFLKAFN